MSVTPAVTAPGASGEAPAGPRPDGDDGRGEPPGRFRFPGSSLRWAVAYTAAVAVGMVVVVGPGSLAWQGGFIAHPPPAAEPVGDHLQMAYFLWLWKHALVTLSHLPWEDVIQFSAGGETAYQPFGWPLVLVSLPATLAAGPVAGYNAVVVAAFLGCAWAAYALARQLGVSRPGAALAGFAFAFAPFRVVQGQAHVNALLAPLLPLLVLGCERALRGTGNPRRAGWATAGVFVTILGSGEFHLAVYAALLLAGWVLLRLPGAGRDRLRALVVPAAVLLVASAAVAAALNHAVIGPSTAAGGRSAEEAAFYAPRLGDLIAGSPRPPGFGERFVYVGLPIALLAAAGLVGLWRRRERLLAAGLLFGFALCTFLAVAPGLDGAPGVQRLARSLPLFGYIRVPGRIAVVSALLLAVAGAFGVDLLRRNATRWLIGAGAMALILADVPAGLYGSHPVPSPLRVPVGAGVLHLPPFEAGHSGGSGYALAAALGTPARTPNGYSPFARPEATGRLLALRPLVELPPDPCRWHDLAAPLGLDHVVVHPALFGVGFPGEWSNTGAETVAAFDAAPGFERTDEEKHGVVVYRIHYERMPCAR